MNGTVGLNVGAQSCCAQSRDRGIPAPSGRSPTLQQSEWGGETCAPRRLGAASLRPYRNAFKPGNRPA
jgi:hypothetical protein